MQFGIQRAMQQIYDFSVRICYTHPEAAILYKDGPSYASDRAAGMDLRACILTADLTIEAGERALIPTGIAIEPLVDNVAGFVYSRSGLGAKKGLTVAQGVGVIDNDYRGEIMVFLLNTSHKAQQISKGERVAQLVFHPTLRPAVQICTELQGTKRGSGGFGHTGKN